jgi:hypothetical protein
MKRLTILKIVLKAASEFFSGLLNLSLDGFLHAITSHWTGVKSPKYIHAWAVYRTIFRITAGFWSKFYSNRRLSECRSKLFEEGYWKDF